MFFFLNRNNHEQPFPVFNIKHMMTTLIKNIINHILISVLRKENRTIALFYHDIQ